MRSTANLNLAVAVRLFDRNSRYENSSFIVFEVTLAFDAGSVDLSNIDTLEDDNIDQDDVITSKREPDGVVWIGNDYFATANEGDMDGGSRSFTIFDLSGNIVYESGSELDHLAAKCGHYPESRSENKGNEVTS